MPEKTTTRLAYIDWLRGFACLTMFQTHCYDSWLGGAAREGELYKLSQQGGTLPTPLFLFLAGVSCALVTDKLGRKGIGSNEIARTTILRGGEIFLLALLFRLQEHILNAIGGSLMLMGLACRIAALGGTQDARRLRKTSIGVAVAIAVSIAIVTPPLWTTWQPHWRTWWLESYINGVHTFGTPQTWLFPLFPWSAFAFAGLAAGFFLVSDWARQKEVAALTLPAVGGVALIALGIWLDARPMQLYAVYDFWHTSPNFFLVRTGVVMVILFAGYAWCRWGTGQWGFSPLIELGKSSLLVYWVHMEFVYGGLSILPKRGVGIGAATVGLLTIITATTMLALVRSTISGRAAEILAFFRRTVRA